MKDIPEWLTKEEHYEAEKSSSAFVDRTILELLSSIQRFEKVNIKRYEKNALVDLLFIIETILCISLSTNMLFTYLIFACFLIVLCMMKSEIMAKIVHGGLFAGGFCALILLPTLFLGNSKTFIRITLKVLLSSSLIATYNEYHTSNEIISCLKALHVPDIFILTLDMTFKYIVMLSKICKEILVALKCRMIGKLPKKDRSMMNVGGMTFIRSIKYSEDMNDAMKCRGFNGIYYNHMKFHLKRMDYFMFIMMLLELIVFLFLGR